MTFSKRTFLALATAIGLGPLAALAEGSEDPIPGIDVIVERDPSAIPVAQDPLRGGQVEKFNSLKGAERSAFLAAIITRSVLDVGTEASPDAIREALEKQMGESWCGPCKYVDGVMENTLKLSDEGLTIVLRVKK